MIKSLLYIPESLNHFYKQCKLIRSRLFYWNNIENMWFYFRRKHFQDQVTWISLCWFWSDWKI